VTLFRLDKPDVDRSLHWLYLCDPVYHNAYISFVCHRASALLHHVDPFWLVFYLFFSGFFFDIGPVYVLDVDVASDSVFSVESTVELL
jgi:hypothetical protein